MATLEFDALVQALQSAVGEAQQAVAKRHQGRMQRMLDLDDDGRVEGVAYFFEVPTDGPAAPGGRSVRLPLMTLRPNVAHQITSVAIELDATVEDAEEEPAPASAREAAATTAAAAPAPGTPAPARSSLILAVKRHGEPVRRALHRIRISLTGPQPGAGMVTIDGTVLKRLDPPEDG